MLQKRSCRPRPEAGKNQDRLAHSRFAHLDAFRGARHAKPVGPRLLQNFRHARPTVAVAIAFDDREYLARSLALFSRGIHKVANGAEVMRQRRRGDLRPDRAYAQFRDALVLEVRPSLRHIFSRALINR